MEKDNLFLLLLVILNYMYIILSNPLQTNQFILCFIS